MYSSAKHNEVKHARESKMMSKAELARKAGVTVQTIDRIERGYECRLATKRKIILALGYELVERTKIFKEPESSQGENESSESSENESTEEADHATSNPGEPVRMLRKSDTVR